MKTFYVTTPIYYANDRPHIGHAYTTIAADIARRWQQVKGRKTFLLTGTDEHGLKIAQAARMAGQEPKEFLDGMIQSFQNLWPKLQIYPDDFIRTTDQRHIKGVQDIFTTLRDKGDIYKGSYEGPYCIPCESFFTEQQLDNGTCPDCGRDVERLKEESYFFKLSKYQEFLLNHYKKHPEFLQPAERAPEMIRFVASGLRDLSVSRTRVPWGIPVPFDQKHTIYVWFDALINYVTGVGFGYDEKRFNALWPADVHFVGKEIFKFHSVIWPAMLHSAGLPLPRMVFAHGWWTVEGEKMSKSLGNVIDPEVFAGEYSVDMFRYFLFREMPFGGDGNFTREAFKRRYNSELANDLGNLISRTLKMIEKYSSAKIPAGSVHLDNAIAREISHLVLVVDTHYGKLAFYQALNHIWKIVETANKYIENKAPWKTAAADTEGTFQVLYTLTWIIKVLAVLICPVMPDAASTIWKRIGETTALEDLPKDPLREPASFLPQKGKRVDKGESLFPRT